MLPPSSDAKGPRISYGTLLIVSSTEKHLGGNPCTGPHTRGGGYFGDHLLGVARQMEWAPCMLKQLGMCLQLLEIKPDHTRVPVQSRE